MTQSAERAVVGCLVVTLAAGCGGGDASGPTGDGVEVRDSAGVRIVVNHEAEWGDLVAWRLDPEPILDLGGVDAPRPEIFSRIAEVELLADGSVVVLDGASNEVRVFGPSGAHRATFGGDGEGPGEFQTFTAIQVRGADTLEIVDGTAGRRLTWLPDGTLVRDLRLDLGAVRERFGRTIRTPYEHWILRPDGNITSLDQPSPPASAGTGLVHTEWTVIGGGLELQDPVALGVFPGRQGPVEVAGQGFMRDLIYGDMSFLAGEPEAANFHVRPAGTSEIRSFNPTGELRRIVRLGLGPQPVTRAMVEHLWGLVGVSSQEEFDAGVGAGIVVADSLPITFSMRTDPADRIWLPDPGPLADPSLPSGFQIVDSDGRWLGRMAVPFRATPDVPIRIGTDRIAVVERDEFEVEHVRVYAILREG